MHARTLQCNGRDNESRIMKPMGHEQFYASLTAAKLATIGTLSPNVEDQVLDPNPTRCTNHQMLFQKENVLEEPIASTDAKP